jgi:LysR family transcriptional activator for leuABCD operon
MEATLRGVDLNLLTVFDAVMQEQNITRAAHNLGMSQPAVSNAVSRLKQMFNDELFMRHGRGILPTPRARQLFDPIRQALQLVRNELPGAFFSPETSTQQFKLAVSSPNDLRFAAPVLAGITKLAPKVQLQLDADLDGSVAEKMRYQDIDFVIDYTRFEQPGFVSSELFIDELVVVAALDHPRIGQFISSEELLLEQHARLSDSQGRHSYSEQAYRRFDVAVAYRATSLSSVLDLVSQSELLTIAPRWLVDNLPVSMRKSLRVLGLPCNNRNISGYLSWHESSEKDKGHLWLRDQLMTICAQVITDRQSAA